MDYEAIRGELMAIKDPKVFLEANHGSDRMGSVVLDATGVERLSTNLEGLNRLGIYLGYGDSFVLGNRGVAIVGHGGVGKSFLMNEFVKSCGAKQIAEDSLTLTKREDGGFDLRRSPWLKGEEPESVIERYVRYLQVTKGARLTDIIHLKETKGNINGFVEPTQDEILGFFNEQAKLEPIKLVPVREVLKGVKVSEYAFTATRQSLPKAFIDIRALFK